MLKIEKKKTTLNCIINYVIYRMIMKYQSLKIITILATNINILNKFRTRQKFKMELFAIIVNILSKSYILDVFRVLHSPQYTNLFNKVLYCFENACTHCLVAFLSSSLSSISLPKIRKTTIKI